MNDQPPKRFDRAERRKGIFFELLRREPVLKPTVECGEEIAIENGPFKEIVEGLEDAFDLDAAARL